MVRLQADPWNTLALSPRTARACGKVHRAANAQHHRCARAHACTPSGCCAQVPGAGGGTGSGVAGQGLGWEQHLQRGAERGVQRSERSNWSISPLIAQAPHLVDDVDDGVAGLDVGRDDVCCGCALQGGHKADAGSRLGHLLAAAEARGGGG